MGLIVKEYHKENTKNSKTTLVEEYRLDSTQQTPKNGESIFSSLILLIKLLLTKIVNILRPRSIISNITSLLRNVLLPVGYPDSVCPEYIEFQIWDTIYEACGYFRAILKNQAWLTVLGVGNAQASVVSAVVMTMMVDYSGMVSGLYFAGSQKRVKKFAANQKYWTMVYEILVLISVVLTLVSSFFPEHLILILVIGRLVYYPDCRQWMRADDIWYRLDGCAGLLG